jgi:hypothetical protein
MIKVQFKGLKEFERALKGFPKAVAIAAKEALSTAAFEARQEWQRTIGGEFTLRNKFVAGRALQVEKARSLDIDKMRSKVGSVFGPMSLQESGGVSRGSGGARAIPTRAAAGQSGHGVRTKVIRGANKLSALGGVKQARALRAMPIGQRRYVQALIAKRRGQKHVLLDRPNGGKGIYAIMGGNRRLSTRLIYDVSRSSYSMPKHETLGPAVERVNFQRILNDSFRKQMKFHKLI